MGAVCCAPEMYVAASPCLPNMCRFFYCYYCCRRAVVITGVVAVFLLFYCISLMITVTILVGVGVSIVVVHIIIITIVLLLSSP